MKQRRSPIPPLAARVLADHERAPDKPFYDLLSLGSLFDSAAVAQLDEAYAELERRGLVEQVAGEVVRFGGNTRPTFRIRVRSARASARKAS
jgi:hypothetical protein